MCLAVPGRIISIETHDNHLLCNGLIDFSGVRKKVSLAYLPEAKIGDYVIVHAGFALSQLDEEEALASLQAFADLASYEKQMFS